MKKNEILYEDREIYDGWCASYDTETGEVRLRDAWFVERLSKEQKEQLIAHVKKSFES